MLKSKIYFEKLNKLAVINNFLAFICFYFKKFSLLAPDPGGKMNGDPCGSGFTALVFTSGSGFWNFDQDLTLFSKQRFSSILYEVFYVEDIKHSNCNLNPNLLKD